MANVSKIEVDSDWGKEAPKLNANFNAIGVELAKLKNTTSVNIPLFSSVSEVQDAIPNPYVGKLVYVGTSLPASVYKWNGSTWQNTGLTGGSASAPLTNYYTKEEINEQKSETDNKFSELETDIIKKTTELNISVLYPTQGIGGTNKYDLATAIAQVPAEYRTIVGLKITYIDNETEEPDTRVYSGGEFSDVGNWGPIATDVDKELNEESEKPIANAPVAKGINEVKLQLSTQLPAIEEAKDEALQAIDQNEQSAILNFNAQRVTPEMLSESTKQFIEASGGGTVTNLADDEDIESRQNDLGIDVLKFADRPHNPTNFSGKGRKILRKNIVEGKNVLTQDMINDTNTVYEIRYDFDLNDSEITIPEGCVLQFDGGSISNGILIGDKTDVKADTNSFIFNDIRFSGNWKISNISPNWFGATGDGASDDTYAIQSAIDLTCLNSNRTLLIPIGTYLLSPQNLDKTDGGVYHLKVSNSVNIIGENRNNTKLKRVKTDLSDPSEELYTEESGNTYGHMIRFSTDDATDSEIFFSVENITLDGNQKWEHYGFGGASLLDKAVAIVGSKNPKYYYFRNLYIKDNVSEGIYSHCYDDTTQLTYDMCYFSNIGGSATCIGGDHVSYKYCIFYKAAIEQAWSNTAEVSSGLISIDHCQFYNRLLSMVSVDYQGNQSDKFKANRHVNINGCIFMFEKDYYDNYIKDTDKQDSPCYGVFLGNCESATITNNQFMDIGNAPEQGGSILSLKEGVSSVNRMIIDNNIVKSNFIYTRDLVVSSANNVILSNHKNIAVGKVDKRWQLYKNTFVNNYMEATYLSDITGTITSSYNYAKNRKHLVRIQIINNNDESANVSLQIYDQSNSSICSKAINVNKGSNNITFACYSGENIDANTPYSVWRRISVTSDISIDANIYISDSTDIPADAVLDTYYRGGQIFGDDNRPLWWKGYSWGDVNGLSGNLIIKGTTQERPTPRATDDGFEYYDSTLKKKILWNGTEWTNLDGTMLV